MPFRRLCRWSVPLALVGCLWGMGRPVGAADVQVVAPADKSVVRGVVQFRIRPVEAPGERYFSNPEVVLVDEDGKSVANTVAVRDPKTKLCELTLDTARYPDGVYLLTVDYRNLAGDRARNVRSEINLSFRNRGPKPARFVVDLPATAKADDTGVPVTVRVYDARDQLLPGARVEFQAVGGELDSAAELTFHDGEATATVQSEKAGNCNVTIRVEALPSVTRTVRFGP